MLFSCRKTPNYSISFAFRWREKCDSNFSEKGIEDSIKIWLKHAPERFALSILRKDQ